VALTVTEVHMAEGRWSADVNWTPDSYDKLTVVANGRRKPRKLYFQLYDPAAELTYVGLLTRVKGDEKGLTIGGPGMIWHPGGGGIGPRIADREYISGANKLGNPVFTLGALYWQRPAEGSLWVIPEGGPATCAGGLVKDDILESDERFPVRPGNQYRAQASGVSGVGKGRVRTLYEGKFDPPNLWTNGDLAAGDTGWTESAYVTVVPGTMFGGTNVVACAPIPKPVIYAFADGLDGGVAWTDISEFPGDMDIVDYGGLAAIRCGPVTQKDLIPNGRFEADISRWYTNTEIADPATPFYHDTGQGTDGSNCFTTAGVAGTPDEKFARVQFSADPGVDPADVVAGEEYELEGFLWPAPSTDGQAHLYGHIPHPTSANHEKWYPAEAMKGSEHSVTPAQYTRMTVRIPIPPNRDKLNIGYTVSGHHSGYWHLDDVTCKRVKGNRAKITSDVGYAVEVDTRYEVAGLAQSGDDLQVGSYRVGGMLVGDTVDPETVGEDKGSTDFEWEQIRKEFRPSTGQEFFYPFVSCQDIIGAPVYVRRITITKLDNNRAGIIGGVAVVTPERTYKVRCKVRSGPNLNTGNIKLSMRCIRAGYPDVIIESATMDGTDGEVKELAMDLTPPSGYEEVERRVIFTDVDGDLFYAADFTFVDTDTATVVYDSATVDPSEASVYVDSTAPAGAQFVRTMFVAEGSTSGWSLAGMSLARTGVTPATGDAIVAQLLTDPDTGDPLSLAPGTIDCPEVIPYDWLILNLTDRDALEHYCSVISDPPREYRVNPADPPTIDVATTVGTDHGPDSAVPVTLLPRDRDVESMDDPEVDVTDRPTHILVIGADRKTVSGQDFPITAVAEVPGTAELDYNERPIVRVKPVSASTVDHQGYADALAIALAAREAEPPLSVSVKLSGVDTRPGVREGDTIYLCHPEAGLDDPDLADPPMIEGETVFHRPVRVLSRTRSCGPGYTAFMRRSDGSRFELPGVIWSDEDATTLVVGDRLTEVESGLDPSQIAAVEWMRDRASRPR